MIIVTGGAGFIGSNLVHALNQRGRTDIVVVDDMTDGRKFTNLATATIADYLDREEFRTRFRAHDPAFSGVEVVYHLGACSTTTEWNGRLMLDTNFAYSRDLFEFCQRRGIRMVYASSAAVYGAEASFREDPACERPLNVYGYSKLLFDQYVRRSLPHPRAPVTGLRYFNVYGPREGHKDRMASVILHFNQQLITEGVVKLFDGSHGVAAGEQTRDFVHVDDVVNTTLWFGEESASSGIYNCGTGQPATFNAVAETVLQWHGRGSIEYIPFPADLLRAYQSHTKADLTALRAAGHMQAFRAIDHGIPSYLDWLNG